MSPAGGRVRMLGGGTVEEESDRSLVPRDLSEV